MAHRPPAVRPATTLLAAVVLLPSAGAVHAQQRFELTGDEVVIYNVAGEVDIERGGSGDVEVVVTPAGGDAARLRVESGPLRGRSTLRVVYPDDQVAYRGSGRGSRTTLRVREDGTFGAGGRRLRVSPRGGLEAHANLRVRVPTGRRVALFLGVGEVRAAGIDGDLLIDVAAAPVHVNGFSGALLIDTGSGRVEVEDARGEISIDSGSGSIDVADIAGPRLRIDTGSGSVDGAGIQVARLEVDTGSGGIDLQRVTARLIELDTGSGGIALELLSDVERAVLDTGSGSVRLRIPATLGAALSIDTGSGGIDVDVPVQVTRQERRRLEGSLGDGNGRIEIDTGSGSVRISGG